MEKLLFLIILLFCAFPDINAEEKEVILESKKNENVGTGNLPSRTPVRAPRVYINDYLLTFESVCVDCIIDFVQNDEVVFSTVVDENGEIMIPSYLIGVYDIQFQLGSIIFVGEIVL